MDAIQKFEEYGEGGEHRKCAEQVFENRLQGRKDCNSIWAGLLTERPSGFFLIEGLRTAELSETLSSWKDLLEAAGEPAPPEDLVKIGRGEEKVKEGLIPSGEGVA